MCETKLQVNYPDNNCGAWLTRNKVGCVFFEARKGQLFLAFSTGTMEKSVYDIALSFNKNGIELQYFNSNEDRDAKYIAVDNSLVYDLLLDMLKKLEQKALEIQPVKPIIK